jgi:HAD superfamily hydrolase (TIGR01509 family)
MSATALGEPARHEETGPRATRLELVVAGGQRLELDTVAARWQLGLDAAQRALAAAGQQLSAAELGRRQRALAEERDRTRRLLTDLAQVAGVRPAPWLSPVPVSAPMLGLPETAEACLFDLDGVLTNSAVLHASAWAEVFDRLLLRLSERTGWQFVPFDRDADYRAYIDGRPRLEGIHVFLASRGIRLPEGRPDDAANADTAYGLGRRKSEALGRAMHDRGVTALPGARRYLEAAGHAGLQRAVVSASASTGPMLELAGLSTLVESSVDADVIRVEHLRARPAPDMLVAACRRLGVSPERTVTLTHSPAGVAAGRSAGVSVIGVGRGRRGELLRGFGAEHVVGSVDDLLDRRLR